MSKVVKGVKKFLKSKVGKAILIGAAVFVGGAALGMWKAPGALARVNGILAKGGSAAGGAGATSTASTVGAAATPALGPVAAPAAQTAGQALATSVMPPAVGGTGAALGATTPAATLPAGGGVTLGNVAASELAEQGVKKGVISRMMEGAANAATSTGSWMAKNPLPSAMIAQGVAGALTPDQIEIRREEQRLAVEEDERQRRERNKALRMDGTESSYNPEYGPLKFASTGQNVFANNGVLSKFKGVI